MTFLNDFQKILSLSMLIKYVPILFKRRYLVCDRRSMSIQIYSEKMSEHFRQPWLLPVFTGSNKRTAATHMSLHEVGHVDPVKHFSHRAMDATFPRKPC